MTRTRLFPKRKKTCPSSPIALLSVCVQSLVFHSSAPASTTHVARILLSDTRTSHKNCARQIPNLRIRLPLPLATNQHPSRLFSSHRPTDQASKQASQPKNENKRKMHLMYTSTSSASTGEKRTYTLKKVLDGTVTKSAHPARFSPDDKYSRHRVVLKKRYGLLLTQRGEC